MRIQFKKKEQRKFFDLVLQKTNCPSLRSFISRGFDISYSTLKSYYNENRTLPEDFFNQLCVFAELNLENLKFKRLNEHWGQVLGGKN